MTTTAPQVFDRRTLGRATGVLGLAAAGLAVSSTAARALPASPRISLTSDNGILFTRKALAENRNQQALAFDVANHRLFILQGRRGSTTGVDLCLNRVSFTGAPLGTMYMDNVGHGASFGVEPVGADSYIWMQARADSTGQATALMRFKWVAGTRPANVSYHFTGSKDISCAIDPLHQRLLVRRVAAGTSTHIHQLFALPFGQPFATSTPLNSFTMPLEVSGLGVLAGFVPYGRYLYVFTGTNHATAADIDSKLSTIDMDTKQVVSKTTTLAGSTLPYREPEGLGIYRTTAGTVGLYFGFASRELIGGTTHVLANVFVKDDIAPAALVLKDPRVVRAALVATAKTATSRVPRSTIMANVGPVNKAVMTVLNGDQTLTAPGQVLKDKIVNGRVFSRNVNQLIDNCIIRGGPAPTSGTNGLIDCASNATSNLIVRNTLIQPSTPSLFWAAGIVGARWTAECVEVRNTTDGLWPRDCQQGTTVRPPFNCAAYYLWIHDLAKFWPDPFQRSGGPADGSAGNGTHNDGIQFFGGSGWRARAFIIDANLDPTVGNTGGLDVNYGGSPIAGKNHGNAAVQINSNSNGSVVMQSENLDFQYGYIGRGGLSVNGLAPGNGNSNNLGTFAHLDFFTPQWYASYPGGTANHGRIFAGPAVTWTDNVDSERGVAASMVRTTTT